MMLLTIDWTRNACVGMSCVVTPAEILLNVCCFFPKQIMCVLATTKIWWLYHCDNTDKMCRLFWQCRHCLQYADYLKENLCEEALHLAGSELELPSSLNRIQDVRISFRLKQERKMLWLWLCLFIIWVSVLSWTKFHENSDAYSINVLCLLKNCVLF